MNVVKSVVPRIVPGVLLISGWALAASPVPSPEPSLFPEPAPALGEPKALRFFENALSKPTGSLRIKNLSRAYGLVLKKKFSLAISLYERKGVTDLYQDYEFWILFQAYKGLALQQTEKKQFELSVKNAKKAVSAFLNIEEHHPFSPFIRILHQEIGKAELILGENYYSLGRGSDAKKAYENAFQRLDSPKDRLSIRTRDVVNYADECKKTPNHFCKEWLKKLSFAFRKRSEEAQAIYRRFPDIEKMAAPFRMVPGRISSLPYKSPDLDQTAFDQAIKVFFQKKYSDAVQLFSVFLDTYPRSSYRFRAKFWMAQALSHKKEFDRSKKYFQDLRLEAPLSYYGLLSASALGIQIDSLINSKFELQAIDQDTNLLPSERFHVQRAENLIREGSLELAQFELKEIKSKENLSSPFVVYLAYLNNRAKNFSLSFQYWGELSQRKYEGILSPLALGMMFPTDFLESVSKHASQMKIDPLLVLSLIKQESAFNQEIISSSGAVGLMQLMPGTALETDLEIKSQDLLIIDKNIRVGTKYLRKLLDRFNGNIALSLAGYNAGPNAADRWYKASQAKQDLFEFIEFIPYKETREYVASIIRNYFWYCAQLKKPLPEHYNYFWAPSKVSDASIAEAVPMPEATPRTPSPTPSLEEKSISPSPLPGVSQVPDATPVPTVLPRETQSPVLLEDQEIGIPIPYPTVQNESA